MPVPKIRGSKIWEFREYAYAPFVKIWWRCIWTAPGKTCQI